MEKAVLKVGIDGYLFHPSPSHLCFYPPFSPLLSFHTGMISIFGVLVFKQHNSYLCLTKLNGQCEH